MNLLSQTLWVSWPRAVFGLFSGSSGAAHGGVLRLFCLSSLYHEAYFPFGGFDTKFGPSIKTISLFYGLGLFGAVWGYFGLFLGALGRHMGLS